MAASAGPAVKSALVSALTTAYAVSDPTVLVTYGHPGVVVVPDIVAVMGVEAEQDPGPMRVSPATREERLSVSVVLSAYVGGGQEAQRTVTERAYALLAVLETALRADITLGGVCRKAQLTSYVLAEPDDPDTLALGRVAEIAAVVAVETRI